ncbi:hypothetical protein BHE74_00011726, partial [Ensete ventricosum]
MGYCSSVDCYVCPDASPIASCQGSGVTVRRLTATSALTRCLSPAIGGQETLVEGWSGTSALLRHLSSGGIVSRPQDYQRMPRVLLLPSPLLLQTGQMPFSGSFSVRVVPSTSLEGTRSEGWETSISGSSHLGIPSPEDAQSRRDLEVLKYCHDIASVISEEALESIRECYSIPEGYVLQAPLLKQRPYQPRPSEISISVNALEAGAMDLNVLRKKLGMPGGKSAPAVGPEGAQPEVEVIHTEASAKQPVGSLIADQATVGRPGKWVKIAVRKHKSHR